MVMDYATAELVKVAANSFLATKISFINAMAELCEVAGGDVTQLADAIGVDERIGRKFLNAGLGFGGGCLPKDIRAFMARAEELHAQPAVSFLKEIDSINMRRRDRMVDLTVEALGAGPWPAPEWRSSVGVQARERRRARLAGAGRRPEARRAVGGVRGHRPASHGERPAQGSAPEVRTTPRRKRSTARTWFSC